MPDDCVLACITVIIGRGRKLLFRWTLPVNRPEGQI